MNYHLMREEDVALCGASDGLFTYREDVADCPACWRAALAASEARAKEIVDSLLSFGWTIADPWYTKRHDRNHIEVHDSGPICPVCGQAAPWDENWPLGFTMEDPANHDPECALIPYLTS